jgi:hypothetical protein
MKAFLRHLKTGHYYRGNSEWASAKADAADFGTIENALSAATRDRLDGMSVAAQYDETITGFQCSFKA